MKKPLSTLPARRDLTDREVAIAIGGIIGGFTRLASVESVKAAIQWWAETPEAWKMFEAANGSVDDILGILKNRMGKQ